MVPNIHLTDRVAHFLVKIFREYDWHHVSLIVDETFASNILVRSSIQTTFKESESEYELFVDVQAFNNMDANITTNYTKLLHQSSKTARGKWQRSMNID